MICFFLAFTECGREHGVSVAFKCRNENNELWQCLDKWYKDEEFKAECTKVYLDKRSEYRRTGITDKAKKRLQTAIF